MTRLQKKVINLDHDGDRKVACAWEDCELDGYDSNKVRVNYGTAAYPQIVRYVFCTERHRQFWIYSSKKYGQLPPGYRMSTI